MLSGIWWFFQNLAMSFYNFGYAITHPNLWLDWSNKEALMRFIYYGGSAELFFVILTTFLIATGIGLWRNDFMWGCVRGLEGFANAIGRFFCLGRFAHGLATDRDRVCSAYFCFT